ncbi:ArsR/SmtB family transcription factor [Arthrobacter russicus]|uniref:DNA-binding transcriptional ArsR family regulator n=1 Tax=Arthrobacter russicus TaxID=172040 RepID=A0ABU1JDV2_9MICC|nr:metalloregulator ArsR/SmtB family transcription factor [Arthrobacter russicus]MDR6270061.1 DNA-binding transcriptional ArsR family regulator [Arthrobacter russicus]
MESSKIGKYEAEPAQEARLDAIFSALAHPVRRHLIDLLHQGDATVNELAAPFELGTPAISKHLTILEKAGLIKRTVKQQWRTCSLEPTGFVHLKDWTEHYANLWEGSLQRLDTLLEKLQATTPEKEPEND